VFWTLGYDTIYAHQDKEDDALIGVRSTARLLGARTKAWLCGFYGAAWLSFVGAGFAAGLGVGFFLVVSVVAGHFVWQILRLDIDDGANCLVTFKSNRDLGAVMFLAILAGIL
jgi:4-hydroxybenzoate polyprenyltransferase